MNSSTNQTITPTTINHQKNLEEIVESKNIQKIRNKIVTVSTEELDNLYPKLQEVENIIKTEIITKIKKIYDSSQEIGKNEISKIMQVFTIHAQDGYRRPKFSMMLGKIISKEAEERNAGLEEIKTTDILRSGNKSKIINKDKIQHLIKNKKASDTKVIAHGLTSDFGYITENTIQGLGTQYSSTLNSQITELLNKKEKMEEADFLENLKRIRRKSVNAYLSLQIISEAIHNTDLLIAEYKALRQESIQKVAEKVKETHKKTQHLADKKVQEQLSLDAENKKKEQQQEEKKQEILKVLEKNNIRNITELNKIIYDAKKLPLVEAEKNTQDRSKQQTIEKQEETIKSQNKEIQQLKKTLADLLTKVSPKRFGKGYKTTLSEEEYNSAKKVVNPHNKS